MRKIYIFLFAFIAMTMTAFAQDAQPVPVVKLSGEQISEYPYELPEEDAEKIFALETVTVAVKVTTPDVLSGRIALFCTSDPTQYANTSAKATGSAYVGYGFNNSDIGYLASCVAGDRYTVSAGITVGTENVLVYVLNPTGNNYKSYANGNKYHDRNFGTYEIATPKMVKEDHSSAKIYIGGGMTLEGSREVFTGTIEGVEVYDGELTAEQIAALFPEEPVVVPTKYAVDVRSGSEDWGTVAIEGHDGTSIEVEEGTEITVVATAADGYVFESWNDEQGSTLSTDATYTFAVNAATTVVAWFAQAPEPEPEVKWYRIKETAGNQYMNVYSYNATDEDNAHGLVNVADYNEEGKDQIFTLEETGTDGQYYLHTQDNYYVAAGINSWNVSVSQSSKMAVIFEETTVGDLTTYVLRDGNASGNNYFKLDPVNGNETLGKFVYRDGDATKKATWVLEEVGTVAPAPTYTATARSADEAMGTADVEVVEGVATFTATALEGYEFTGWIEGTATVSTDNPYVVTLSADIELIATFKAAEVVEPGFDWKGEYTVYATVTNETDSWTCPEPITMVIDDYTNTYTNVTTTVIKSFMGIDLKEATGGQGSYPNLNFADDGKSATIYVGTGIYLSQEAIMEGGIWTNCNLLRAKDGSTNVTVTVDENGVISIPDLEIFNDILHDDFATHDITVLSTLTGVKASKGELPEPVEPVAGAAITSVDQLNSAKCYIITSKDTGRGAMYAGAGATKVDMCGVTYNNANACHSVAVNAADPCQQFAFVEFNGKYYLYSVSEKKFLAKDGDVNKLTNEEPFDYVTITKEADAGGDYFSLFINDANYITASPGWCADATRGTCLQTTLTSKSQNDGWDNGAWFTITEIDNLTFDPAEALAILNTPKPEYFTIERVTPAAGVVTELRNITVIPSVYSLAELPTDWTITDADNNSYPVTIDWGMSMFYDVMVMLQEPITAPGTYTLTIPEGSAEDDYGKIVEATTFTWTIEAPEPEEFTITGYTPDAAVESIKTITITFSHDVKATDLLPATDQFPLYKGTGYLPSYMGDWSINGNVLTITFAYEVNVAGTYTVRIPEGLFERVSDGADFTGQNIDFVVSVTDGIDAVGAEDGEQVIYDLTGRKIEKITGAGIYIINGVKKIVK